MNSRAHSYLLTLGHTCTDITQGALPAMLPFLIMSYDLSYAAAAALVFANSIVSALIQPLFGYLGDKVDHPWFMALGVLLAGVGIAGMGLINSYWFIFCCAMVMGTGVALFHPEGGKLANVVAGKDKGTGISNFSVGGNLGFAFGPILAVFALSTWGMRGTLIFLIPTIGAAIILFSQSKAYQRLTIKEAQRISESDTPDQKDDWVGFSKAITLNTMRAIVGNGMITFIPLYWIAVMGQSQEAGALILTAYSLVGAVGSFFGGRIADRVGFKRMVTLSIGLLGPLMLIFLQIDQIPLATVVLLLFALSQNMGYAPMVALGQAYLPNRIGFASGISLGVVVSMGGVAAPGIGAIGDVWGLRASMLTIATVAFVGLAAASLLFMGRNARESIGAPPKKAG
ncbi:MAG: MFS transporter [Coriobacteriia bacterium]|nr:MFS transporter [Coriobacteriia bacterium]